MEFDALVQEFTCEYKPRTKLDKHWVEGAARSLWVARRSSKEFDSMMQRFTTGDLKPATPPPAPPPPPEQPPTPVAPETCDQRVIVKIIDGAVTVRSIPPTEEMRRSTADIPRPDASLARTFGFPHGVPSHSRGCSSPHNACQALPTANGCLSKLGSPSPRRNKSAAHSSIPKLGPPATSRNSGRILRRPNDFLFSGTSKPAPYSYPDLMMNYNFF
jgi:hypothetical protein